MSDLQKRLAPFVLVVLLGAGAAAIGAQVSSEVEVPPLANLDFELDATGTVPSHWFVPKVVEEAGYVAVTVEEQPQSGERCALVTHAGEPEDPSRFGNLMRSFDAAPYRGQRIRLGAMVRAEVAGRNRAQLWLRVDRVGGQRGFFDNMGDRPITGAEWRRYEIVGEVADDATRINLGLMLLRRGKAWIDSVTFETLGPSGAGNEPPRPLVGRSLENLVAFTRLLGYVRYFHPSDEAAVDWEALALAGVGAVEPASSSAELADLLQRFFRPIAPTVRVFVADRRPAVEAFRPSGDVKIVAWRHHGLGTDGEPSIYRSYRVDTAPPEVPGYLVQGVDARPYRGRRLRLRAAARAEGEAGRAELWLKAFAAGSGPPELGSGLALGGGWRTYEIEIDVAEDAEQVGFGLALELPGRAWIDEVSLAVAGEEETPIELVNPHLEMAGPDRSPQGWSLWSTATEGYRLRIDGRSPFAGSGTAVVEWDDSVIEGIPDPSQPFFAPLGGGVSALVPLALYADAAGTLPPASGDPAVFQRPDGFHPSGNDRTTRIAAVAVLWNVFQHFYPYFDVVETDWPQALRRALAAAATDADERAFLDTLRRLVAGLDDGHGNVDYDADDRSSHLPLLWEWIEGQLVVTAVADEGAADLRPGDVVWEIDGQPAGVALEGEMALTSGATPAGRRHRAVSGLARGRPGAAVKLLVSSFDGARRWVELKFPPQWPLIQEPRPDPLTELEPGVVYVDLSRTSDNDIRGALDRLSAARGIVFDMRGYPRQVFTSFIEHLIDEPVTSAQWHVPLVTRPDRQALDFTFSNWSVEPRDPRLGADVAFLIDARAISKAETLMGIVEHYRLGELVGSPTAGTNGNVSSLRLPGGYRVSWTGMKVLKHDGSRHHGVGILPTAPVERTRRGVAEGRDEILERALELVRGARPGPVP